MATEVLWRYSLLFAAKGGGDWNGLKVDQFFFLRLETLSFESRKKLNTNSFFVPYYISYQFSDLSEVLYEWARVLI